MEIYTTGAIFVIAAILVTLIITLAVKYNKGSLIRIGISACEAVLNEKGDELKELDPEQYNELVELLDAMKKMTYDDVSTAEIIDFISKASVQFEKIAKSYGIDFENKK